MLLQRDFLVSVKVMEFVFANGGRYIKKKKKHEKSHWFLRSVVIQLPMSQGTREVQSEVLQSSHKGVCIFWGRERLSQRLQKLESMTFYLYCFNSFSHMPSRNVLFFKVAVSAKDCMVWLVWLDAPFSKMLFWISTILSLCSVGVKSSFSMYAKPCFPQN